MHQWDAQVIGCHHLKVTIFYISLEPETFVQFISQDCIHLSSIRQMQYNPTPVSLLFIPMFSNYLYLMQSDDSLTSFFFSLN